MSAPSVTVVLPTFDRGELLERSIGSVLAQTRLPDELIVVDDGSTDDTLERIDRWRARLAATDCPTRLRYVFRPNGGPSRARNLGVSVARGEWIAFLDSDDEWRPIKLERQLGAAAERPDLRIWHCDEIWIRRGNQVLQRRRHRKRGGRIYRHCLPLCVVSPSAVLLDRSLLEEVGGFDEELPVCEDYDLWLRLCSRYEVGFVDEPLVVKHGGHDDQLSRRHRAIDRFRVRALDKALRQLDLTAEDRRRTVQTLLRKLDILSGGARRRGLEDEAGRYEALAASWRASEGRVVGESR